MSKFHSQCVCDEGCSSPGGLSTGSILLIVYVLNVGRGVRPCRYGDSRKLREHVVEESSFLSAGLKLDGPYQMNMLLSCTLNSAFIHNSIGARKT